MDVLAPFASLYDCAIVGGGHAALAAAAHLAGRGQRVLLVDRRAALAWECGWAFAQQAGSSDDAGWKAWQARLAGCGGWPDGRPDGAQSEIHAHHLAHELGIDLLFYAAPVAVERAGDLLAAVVLGTKSGLRRVRARTWIDASEAGELLAVAQPGWSAPRALSQQLAIAWRRRSWDGVGGCEGALAGIAGARWRFERSGWADERLLTVTLPGDEARPRRAWLPAIAALRAQAGDALAEAVVSHGSLVPLAAYADAAAPAGLAANLASAIPGACGRAPATLAARWELGVAAAESVLRAPRAAAAPSDAPPAWPAAPLVEAGVAVAGLGTGGALAAIAAGRAGADVLGFDPLPFAGGIGTGGGIHAYYFGVRGGLQEEIDAAVRAAMPAFGAPAQVRNFHPDAKKSVLDDLLHRAGVRQLPEATLVAARREGRRIAEALLATPAGPVRVRARGWIDASGDGDLCAAAGASFRLGRAGDGKLHAYTQSCGVTRMNDPRPFVEMVNYDSGCTDPTEVADLTRARHQGVLQHLRAQVNPVWRPTGICPAIGLRQARHLDTDDTLTLDDLIRRRSWGAQAVALTGSHYDNHAIDYQFESDQALFWTWGCGGWPERIAGEIPYGALLPRDLDDTWIACRALGVSEEAHHCVRMMRDIQRIGEATGIAAALAAGGGSRAVDLGELRRRLAASGALPAQAGSDADDAGLGIVMPGADCRQAPTAGDPEAALRGGGAAPLWLLAHDRTPAGEAVVRRLVADPDPVASFRAAAVLAWWRDAAALPRLFAAVESREDGSPDNARTDQLPRWFAALGLLRLVPARSALPALAGIADQPGLPFHARVTALVALEALATAGRGEAEVAGRVPDLVARLLAWRSPDAAGSPRRHPARTGADAGNWYAVFEDDGWQLHLVALRIRRLLGLPAHAAAQEFARDPRATVRKAFAAAGVGG